MEQIYSQTGTDGRELFPVTLSEELELLHQA